MAKQICYRKSLTSWILSGFILLSHYTFGQLYVNTTNSQLLPGSSRTYTSIQEAFKKATPGDTIYLLPGNYSKIALKNINGIPDQPIVLTSYSLEKVTIDGGSKPGNGLRNNGITLDNCSWLVFNNINFENCWTDIV